ncbi:MAG: 23S rRNA (uracil(1939)-C(5))-methyltransferase RlmD [Peptostreptococcaceae bacterium]|nr:23S rRNA (uracil(1939)-C(5))-methyltransferase RlmD [Peptostreptococcaceae bacterium]
MKKRELIDLLVQGMEFGGESFGFHEDKKITFKGGIIGQRVRIMIKKIRKNKIEGKILSVLQPASIETETVCDHFGICGGCTMLSVPYEKQLEIKSHQLSGLFSEYGHDEIKDLIVLSSPKNHGYKNKMEFTFGNESKDAPLSLGMHMKNKTNSVTTVDTCMIIDSDYQKILKATVEYFGKLGFPFYKILSHEGFLRHLVVRKGHHTDELLINLVTTSQMDPDLTDYVELLRALDTQSTIVGILQTINDSFSDAVLCDELKVLYGRDHFYEKLLGLTFKISPFSFFQTNSACAEILYQEVLNLLGDSKNKTLFDLYSGTGTIGMLASTRVKNVIGIEIIEEAVKMANENCTLNQITNAKYIAGDVKDTVLDLKDKPDIILLDPPRSGMHPKAIEDVLSFEAPEIVYVSCNPKALCTELSKFKSHGYLVKSYIGVDQFPNTPHCEMILHLTKGVIPEI